MMKTLTKFDVSIQAFSGQWIVKIRTRVDSRWLTYEEAETRWIELTTPLAFIQG